MAHRSERPGWSELPLSAQLFRVAHGAWGALNMLALALVWRAGFLRRRGLVEKASTGLLLSEGAALVIGRGDCPFGPFQSSLGDPVPMFEWFLPPRAAKAAIPFLTVVTITGLVVMWLRPPKSRQ